MFSLEQEENNETKKINITVIEILFSILNYQIAERLHQNYTSAMRLS